MDATAVVSTALTIDLNNFIKGALNGLSDADLAKRPSDQCNSIGWTLWHATRVEDGIIGNISGKPQVWIEGGWHQKFDMPADPTKSGVGDSLEQVAAFKPTVTNLQGYAEAVREKTLACLNTLTPADLDRDLPPPGGGDPRKVGAWLS
ncbi:MAG TPA: DinB family protein, partial [Candidatus Saccharimonadia bacterium]|nr:DinB family protein [Candidatus Saccharimonadia bacterium]